MLLKSLDMIKGAAKVDQSAIWTRLWYSLKAKLPMIS